MGARRGEAIGSCFPLETKKMYLYGGLFSPYITYKWAFLYGGGGGLFPPYRGPCFGLAHLDGRYKELLLYICETPQFIWDLQSQLLNLSILQSKIRNSYNIYSKLTNVQSYFCFVFVHAIFIICVYFFDIYESTGKDACNYYNFDLKYVYQKVSYSHVNYIKMTKISRSTFSQ